MSQSAGVSNRCGESSVPSYRRRALPYQSYEVRKDTIGKFLNQKKMSKDSLARALKITVRKLDQLLLPDSEVPRSLLAKVSLPLAHLYCSTDWRN